MVPLGTLIDVTETLGPQVIPRYNLYPSASLTGQPEPGYSSGQALAVASRGRTHGEGHERRRAASC